MIVLVSDPWHLIADEKYQLAIEAYTELIASGRGAAPHHRNRATAYLLLGRTQEARTDHLAAQALDPPPRGKRLHHSDSDTIRIGITYWLESKKEMAASTWLQITDALAAGHVDYSDAAGGAGPASIARFAAARLARADLRRSADRLLERLAQRHRTAYWPMPLVEYYLDRLDADALVAKISDVPVLRERELCQARFATAVRQLEVGAEDRFRTLMAEAAVSPYGSLEDEFFLARYEAQQDASGHT
jgi:hypothetical protein